MKMITIYSAKYLNFTTIHTPVWKDWNLINFSIVISELLSIGIALPKVFEVYSRLYTASDPVWMTKGAPYHLLRVLAKLSEKFAGSPSSVPVSEW